MSRLKNFLIDDLKEIDHSFQNERRLIARLIIKIDIETLKDLI